MKIIYSPHFASRPYVDLRGRDGVLFAEKPMGTHALLNELELRVGLTAPDTDGTERLIRYVKAMRKALSSDPKLFFADSFALDEIGTAKVILAWRDALVMALWDGSERSTEKLSGIAAVEAFFDYPGYVDRWKGLVEYLEKTAVVPEGLSIELRVPLASLDGCVRRSLELLSGKGVPVVESLVSAPAASRKDSSLWKVQDALLHGGAAGKKETLPDDGSFRHVWFRLAYDACQWAAQDSPEWKGAGSLLVCPSPATVNESLRVLGLPSLKADIDGAPQSLQLFLLGLSLFRAPVDVERLLSYLRVPVNPIGRLCLKMERKDGTPYYKPLNRELTDRLLETGGMDGWDEVIGNAVYDHDGKELSKRERDEVLGRFLMWKKVDASGKVSREDVLAYLKNLRRWADGCSQVIEGDPGYAALSASCKALELLAEDTPGAVTSDRLIRWAEGLFEPVGMSVGEAEAESPDCVSDVRNISDSPETVVCLGFNASEGGAYPYAFLSEKECRLVGAPTHEDYARYDHDATVAALASVKGSLTLVTYDFEEGNPTTEHPVITELKARFDFPRVDGLTMERANPCYDILDAEPDDRKQAEYKVKKELFKGLDRRRSEGGILPDRESYSSLDMLIQTPFDYVLEKLLGFEAYGEAQLSDVSIVKGNVAHLYVETLVEESGADLSTMEKLHAERFGELVLRCAECKGAILLGPESALEWGKFKNILHQSVSSLLALIRLNGYTVVASEKHLETEFPVIGPFHAFVDLLLKDRKGRYVIFDLKWSEGATYERKMEERDIIQLILYKEIVERTLGPVSVYGYWVFPRYEFLTESGEVVGDGVVSYQPEAGAPAPPDIFTQVCNSYTFRLEQIRRGVIEEGECFEKEDLEYYREQDSRDLYPLRGMYGAPTAKARPYGDRNITLKGGLE